MTTDSPQNPEPLPGEPSAAPEKPQRPRLTSTPTGQNIFVGLMVLATLGVVALLGGAFVVGNNVAGAATEEPVAVEQAPAEPEISFPTLSGEPLGPGPTDWLELRGGECLSPFSDAFDSSLWWSLARGAIKHNSPEPYCSRVIPWRNFRAKQWSPPKLGSSAP